MSDKLPEIDDTGTFCFQVGKSKQFISPYQANPFDNCYK
ncbi:unnamed protein product, partial [Brugia pahangi]